MAFAKLSYLEINGIDAVRLFGHEIGTGPFITFAKTYSKHFLLSSRSNIVASVSDWKMPNYSLIIACHKM